MLRTPDSSGGKATPGAAARGAPGPDGDAVGEAVGELVGRYWRPLVAYATRLMGDDLAAEDIVQRAFVRIWENRHQIPGGGAERPYLYRVVRNLASNEWRRLRTRHAWLETAWEHELAPATADAAVEEEELATLLARAVERLPPRRREVFVLSRYHGLTNGQVAEVLSLSPQTVANQLVSALRSLRSELGPHLGELPHPPLALVRDEGRAAG